MKLKKEAKIGIFGVGMIFLLYWGMNFLKGQDIFSRTNTYYATYEQVNGIQKSSPIVIKGFRVGTISNMSYNPAGNAKIVLQFDVKSKYNIPKNSKARIYSADLLGGKAVEIVLGNSSEFLSDGDTIHSEMDKDILELAGSEFQALKDKAVTLIDGMTTTLDNINRVLSDQNIQNMHSTLANLASVSGNVNTIFEEESPNLKSLISNMNQLSTTLRKNTGRIDNIVKNLDQFTDSLNQAQIPTLITQINTTMAQLNTTIEQINSGKGTVGKFLNDERLYDSLVVASSNLSTLLRDLEENPKRYVHFSLFGGGNKKKK